MTTCSFSGSVDERVRGTSRDYLSTGPGTDHLLAAAPLFSKAKGGAVPLMSGAKLAARPRSGHRRPERCPVGGNGP